MTGVTSSWAVYQVLGLAHLCPHSETDKAINTNNIFHNICSYRTPTVQNNDASAFLALYAQSFASFLGSQKDA